MENMKNLNYLDLDSNSLNGSIPETISELTNLEKLILYENELSGKITLYCTKELNLYK